jgi:hypothetical protein
LEAANAAMRKVQYAREIERERQKSASHTKHRTSTSVPISLSNTNTAQFLHTNMEDYMAKFHKPKTCISCLDCIRPKDKHVSYKYPRNMTSTTQDTFHDSKRYRTQAFELDKER